MKFKPLVIAPLALLLLCAVPVFAASKHSADITVDQPLKVAQAGLKPGDYKVEWQGEGSPVQVKFLQNDKVVATAPATVEANDSQYQDGFEAKTQSDNSQVLHKIYSKKTALDFQSGAGAGGN